jgi:hypothetical protein
MTELKQLLMGGADRVGDGGTSGKPLLKTTIERTGDGESKPFRHQFRYTSRTGRQVVSRTNLLMSGRHTPRITGLNGSVLPRGGRSDTTVDVVA